MEERVILVDKNDNEVGTMEKMEAHLSGELHRAFSVFVFNSAGDLLLQQRAADKYHSGGKWTNTCCSHPRPGEDILSAANRRLMEEMGMACKLTHAFSFTYCADIDGGLTENEYDHVFFGISDLKPVPAPQEVAAFKYMPIAAIAADIETNAADYTEWLKICFAEVVQRCGHLPIST